MNSGTDNSKKNGNRGALRQNERTQCKHCACFVFSPQCPFAAIGAFLITRERSHLERTLFGASVPGHHKLALRFFPWANNVSRGHLRKEGVVEALQHSQVPVVVVHTRCCCVYTYEYPTHVLSGCLISAQGGALPVGVTLSALPQSLPAGRIYGYYRGFTSAEVWNASTTKRSEKGT